MAISVTPTTRMGEVAARLPDGVETQRHTALPDVSRPLEAVPPLLLFLHLRNPLPLRKFLQLRSPSQTGQQCQGPH